LFSGGFTKPVNMRAYSVAVLNNTFSIPPSLQHLPKVDAISANFTIYLVPSAEGVGILIPTLAKTPYYVNFQSQQMLQRSSKALQQNELIVRACKIKDTNPCRVVDATAGFGRDAFILAASGFHVCLVERHNLLALLLDQAIAQISAEQIKTRLSLIHDDSQNYLKKLALSQDKPEVVYLDPMFTLKRHAKVKKDLQILQYLLDDTADDSNTLLPLAQQAASKKVVVKRAIDAPPLNACKPAFSFSGKHTRFDIYLPAQSIERTLQ
jgi:16S rRNA (guanine1516-N2)-methyltransferase